MNSKDEKVGIMWNVLGSVANAASSAILLLFVTRIVGAKSAGVFSIAYVTAQMLMSVGNYGVRAFQVSDKDEKYSFQEYEKHRFITCLIMMLMLGIFVCFRRYEKNVAIIIVLMGIYKMLDALSDVYEGWLQQHHFLALAGKSLFIRTFLSIIAFVFILFLTQDMVYASIGAIIISMLMFYILAYSPVYKLKNEEKKILLQHIGALFWNNFPLFISLILLAYIVNIPKYAIEAYMTYEEQTCYNIIFLPAQVIYLLATFVFKPFLTNLTDVYYQNLTKFRRLVLNLISITVGITIVVIWGSNIIGIPVLEFLYGIKLQQYKEALLIILVGGGFNAISSFMYYMLAIMRKQFISMIAYMIGMVCALVMSIYLVEQNGVLGAAVLYCLSMFVIMVIMLMTLFFVKERTNRNMERE